MCCIRPCCTAIRPASRSPRTCCMTWLRKTPPPRSHAGTGVAAQPACERGGGVLRSQVMQHVRGEREAGRMAVQHGLIQHIFHQHRFAEAIGTQKDDVGGLADEGEGEDCLLYTSDAADE